MSYSYYLTSKWTKGEEVEKSIRKTNNDNSQTSATSASATALEMGGASGPSGETESGFTRQANKRDAFNEMLSHRDLHTQVGQNPFLAGESYLNHLKIQEDFLRPQNTAAMEPKKDS